MDGPLGSCCQAEYIRAMCSGSWSHLFPDYLFLLLVSPSWIVAFTCIQMSQALEKKTEDVY